MTQRWMWKTAVAGAAALAGVLTSGQVPAQAATAPGWHVWQTVGNSTSHTYPEPLSEAGYYPGIAATGRRDAWALFSSCGSARCGSILEHWNGTRWSARRPAALEKLGNPAVLGASSASDVWIFGGGSGNGSRPHNPAVHWNGHSWSWHQVPSWVVRTAPRGDEPTSAAVFSPRDMWVFGLATGYGSRQRLAGHFNGHRWVKVHLPAIPVSVSAVSRSDIWVLGRPATDGKSYVLMHWNGKSWRTRALPASLAPAGSELIGLDLAATGPRAAWVQIFAYSTTASSIFLAHWNGTTWQKVAQPSGADLGNMAPDGQGGVWMSGRDTGDGQRHFYHRTGGRWITASVPAPRSTRVNSVDALVRVPGTTTVLAAGRAYVNNGRGIVGVIWRYRR
jgi:hypothetical protein